ncbi:low temperature requirement protein A [Deinococcus irradiatisoli]|uniref:Low temperature requirement protein A n=1 Tax=Deinococcus irradiatisoli TaxID=2202254 RepID=A0A2Z3JEC6_9DEIO|nr:low temperature requirement protein A [Deinococcus irradiatisoli]AWN23315.1 low temperature requirement protein A [Deinococcus irradiatisoli]
MGGLPLHPAAPVDPAAPVSTLELFLDLVFVFTVTQITTLATHPHGPADYLHAVLILLLVWWMYSGYIWLTSNIGTDSAAHRLLMFGGMGGFLLMALSIPHAFAGTGTAFALGYLAVTLIHAGLFKRAPNSSAQAIRSMFGFNLAAALLLLLAALAPTWTLALWLLAVGVLLLSGVLQRENNFQLRPAHFAERHGLILIIALGESVVAIGVGAASAVVSWRLALGALLGLALSAALWWSYFNGDSEHAAELMAHASVQRRPQLALRGFGYGHVLMIAGIIGIAAGIKLVVGHLGGPADALSAWSLAGGLSVYLLGDVLFRWVVGIGRVAGRLALAGLCLFTAPLGQLSGGLVQLAALVALLAALLTLEGRRPDAGLV